MPNQSSASQYEQSFRMLVESIEEYAIYALDADGRVRSWNTGAERITGYRAVEIVGRPYTIFFPEEDLGEGKPDRLLARARVEGRVTDEFWLVRGDGSRFWADVAISALQDEKGGVYGFAVVIRDSTDRRRQVEDQRFLADAARELASSLDYETTLKRIAELAIPRIADWCAVDVLEPHGQIRRLAVAYADPSKMHLAETLHWRYPPHPDAVVGVPKVLRTGEPELYSEVSDELFQRVARDPEHLRLLREVGVRSAMVVPLLAHGHILGALTFAAAESGRRYAAEDLGLAEDLARHAALAVDSARLYREVQQKVDLQVRLNAALSEVAVARERLLAHERETRTEAQRAHQNLQAFLGMVAHDLRSPLATIMGGIQLLQRADQQLRSDRYARLLTSVEDQTRRMNEMIGLLLDAARIGSGQFEVRPEPTDLAALVRRAVDAARATTERHHIVLEVAEGLAGEWDPERLLQLLDNLLRNAVKYTPEGGRIALRVVQEGEQVLLAVSDTGVGMDPQEIPQLFQLFSRLSTGGQVSGTGLGLYISRGIVEAHGGSIQAESEGLGRGSTFTVRLPVVSPSRQTASGSALGTGR